MADKKKKLDYDLGFTHLQNNQNITAYNLFLNLAENQKKIDTLKSAVLFILAGECKYRQNKDNANEILEAGKSFLNFAKNENNYNIKNAFDKSKKLQVFQTEVVRPVVIVDDSKSVIIKLQNYLKKLGYNDVITFETGTEAIKESQKLIKSSKNPIFLLDMGLR